MNVIRPRKTQYGYKGIVILVYVGDKTQAMLMIFNIILHFMKICLINQNYRLAKV